jgi:hypothetical protein
LFGFASKYAHWIVFTRFFSQFAAFHQLLAQFGRNTAMLFKFHVRQTSDHSPDTFFKPRKENCRNPITDL